MPKSRSYRKSHKSRRKSHKRKSHHKSPRRKSHKKSRSRQNNGWNHDIRGDLIRLQRIGHKFPNTRAYLIRSIKRADPSFRIRDLPKNDKSHQSYRKSHTRTPQRRSPQEIISHDLKRLRGPLRSNAVREGIIRRLKRFYNVDAS